jgi:hypothetical protein
MSVPPAYIKGASRNNNPELVAPVPSIASAPVTAVAPVNVEAVKKNNMIKSNIIKGGMDLTQLI